jgi:hypothetical protein
MIKRPRCRKCQIRVMLVGIEPSFAGPDLRTFQCPRSELTYKALIAHVFHAGSNAAPDAAPDGARSIIPAEARFAFGRLRITLDDRFPTIREDCHDHGTN